MTETTATAREHWHTGRSWGGTRLEDSCPCPKEPCGLVDLSRAVPECDQHPIGRAKTMRQSHRAGSCPGARAQTPHAAPTASVGPSPASPDPEPGSTPQRGTGDAPLDPRIRAIASNAVRPAVDAYNASHTLTTDYWLPITLRDAIGKAVAHAILEDLDATGRLTEPGEVDARVQAAIRQYTHPDDPEDQCGDTLGDITGDRVCVRRRTHTLHNDGRGTSWTHLGPSDLHNRLIAEVGPDVTQQIETIIGDTLGDAWPPPDDLYVRRPDPGELEIVSTVNGLRATVLSEFPVDDANQDVIRWLSRLLPVREEAAP